MWDHSMLAHIPVEAKCSYLEKIMVSSLCSVSITRQRNSTTYRLQICAPSSTPNVPTWHPKNMFFPTYGGNGGIACRCRAAKVASCGPFRNVFKPLDLDRHRFLEEWPHLQTKAKKERFQWLTAAFLNLAHDLFSEPDHYEEGDHRWQRFQCSLRKCLHLSTSTLVHNSREPNLCVIQGGVHDLLPDGIQSGLIFFRELGRRT